MAVHGSEPATPAGLPRLLTVEQVADACQVSARTIRRAIVAGELPAAQIARRGTWRIRTQDYLSWLDDRFVAPAPAALPPRAPLPVLKPVGSPDRVRRRRSTPSSPTLGDGRLAVTADMGRVR